MSLISEADAGFQARKQYDFLSTDLSISPDLSVGGGSSSVVVVPSTRTGVSDVISSGRDLNLRNR